MAQAEQGGAYPPRRRVVAVRSHWELWLDGVLSGTAPSGVCVCVCVCVCVSLSLSLSLSPHPGVFPKKCVCVCECIFPPLCFPKNVCVCIRVRVYVYVLSPLPDVSLKQYVHV